MSAKKLLTAIAHRALAEIIQNGDIEPQVARAPDLEHGLILVLTVEPVTEREVKEAGLTKTERRILGALGDGTPRSSKQIARQIGKSEPDSYVYAVLAKMRQEGLIEKNGNGDYVAMRE